MTCMQTITTNSLPGEQLTLTPDEYQDLLERYHNARSDPNRFENWYEIIKSRSGLATPRIEQLKHDEDLALFLLNDSFNVMRTNKLGQYIRDQIETAVTRFKTRTIYLRPSGHDNPLVDYKSHITAITMDDYQLGTCAINIYHSQSDKFHMNTGFVLQEPIEYPQNTIRLTNGLPLAYSARLFYDFDKKKVLQIIPGIEYVRNYVYSDADKAILQTHAEQIEQTFTEETNQELCQYAERKLKSVNAYPGIYGSAYIWFLDFVKNASGEFLFVNAGIGATDPMYKRLPESVQNTDRKVIRDPSTRLVVKLKFDD